jgi:hypothetical protein
MRPSIEELGGLYTESLGEITEQDIQDHYKVLESRGLLVTTEELTQENEQC